MRIAKRDLEEFGIESIDELEVELLPDTFDPYFIDPNEIETTDQTAWEKVESLLVEMTTAILRSRDKLTTTQIIETVVKRQLGPPIPGPYSHKRSLVHKVPQNAMFDDRVRKVHIAGPSQGSKTLGVTNMMGAVIAYMPGAMMLTYPSEDVALRKVKQDIVPLFQSSDLLSSLVMDASTKTKHNRNVNNRWTFPGGDLLVASTASSNAIKSSPVQFIFNDEIDRTKMARMGDPYLGIEMRQNMYEPYAKTVNASTIEGTEEESLILRYYKDSDQSECFVDCPICSHEQIPDWDANVRFEKGRNGQILENTAVFRCANEKCHHEMKDGARYAMITESLHWKQMAKWECECGREVDPRKDRDARWIHDELADWLSQCPDCGGLAPMRERGFRWNVLHNQVSLVDVVRQFRLAQGNPDRLKVFVNERLTRPFGEASQMPRIKAIRDNNMVDYSLFGRLADGRPVQVPDFVKVVTAVTDPGWDHLATVVLGFGDGNRCAAIYAERIVGDIKDQRTWQRLEEIRLMPYLGIESRHHFVDLHLIDVGDGTRTKYIRNYFLDGLSSKPGILPIRGVRDGPLTSKSAQLRGERFAHHTVGKLAGYRILEDRLQMNPKPEGVLANGEPGSIIFPIDHWIETGEVINDFAVGFDPEFFEQLTNVHMREEYKRGRGTKLIEDRINKDVRIEAFDNMVYGMASLEYVLRGLLGKPGGKDPVIEQLRPRFALPLPKPGDDRILRPVPSPIPKGDISGDEGVQASGMAEVESSSVAKKRPDVLTRQKPPKLRPGVKVKRMPERTRIMR